MMANVDSTTEAGGNAPRVLIVDDHPLMRQVLSMAVERSMTSVGGASIFTAANGEQAVALARAHGPHVVVQDIHLPGVDGFETARHILGEVPGVAVIMVTFTDEPGYRERARARGHRSGDQGQAHGGARPHDGPGAERGCGEGVRSCIRRS